MKRMLFLWLFILLVSTAHAGVTPPATSSHWAETDSDGQPVIYLYMFWSKRCPHCVAAMPDMQALAANLPWLKFLPYELTEHPGHVRLFQQMASLLGQEARSVPTFMFCGQMQVGYDSSGAMAAELRSGLTNCYFHVSRYGLAHLDEFVSHSAATLTLPIIGEVNGSEYSLPVLTLFIAGMDAFNPCAFFVLLFLMSMLVHARSRGRMLLVGVIFIAFSGIIYFLFMAAWLNVFVYFGEIRWITWLAGMLAVVFAVINIKDFFWFRQGVSLSISDVAKPRLFERVRGLLSLEQLPAVIMASIVLAIAVNSYELLCTAGFPLVYTRILTLRGLSMENYYLYLLLYNLIYIVPLLLIVALFVIRLGARKLSEYEGRVLKLLSGMMMLLLGMALIIAPHWLNQLAGAAGVLMLAILSSWMIIKWHRKYEVHND